MRVCWTGQMLVQLDPTNDKEHGGEVGVLKEADGKPSNSKS